MRRLPPKLKGLLWVIAGLGTAAVLTVGLPVVAGAMPWRWEAALGRALGLTPAVRPCPAHDAANALFERIVGRLFPLTPDDDRVAIEAEVVEAPAVNAFATLGGHVYVNSGLLEAAGSPEEVAAVLAHEIEHVKRRHVLQNVIVRLFTWAGLVYVTSGRDPGAINQLLAINFTRAQETEADEGGLRRLQLAHIDNRGFKDFFSRAAAGPIGIGFLSDHPGNRARLALAEGFQNEGVQPLMTAAEWAALKTACR